MSWKNTTAGKEFDLDDPHFTTPMSVISGLASGLCERKAAVDATFNTQSWGANQTGQQKLNTQSATVSNMAANIAITHSTTETSAYAANAETFAAPTSWTQGGQTKTYLDYFDNALVNVANLYVNRGGVAYNGFDGLAAAASARADSDVNVSHYAGYTVDTTATSGGSGVAGDAGRPAYVGTFTPMFRADWAVERRDMLEELRYVHTTGAISDLTYTGKDLSIGVTNRVIYKGDDKFDRYPAIDAPRVPYHDHVYVGWKSGTQLVYTDDDSPSVGSNIYDSSYHTYTRDKADDNVGNDRYAWSNTNETPPVVYTDTPYNLGEDRSSETRLPNDSFGGIVIECGPLDMTCEYRALSFSSGGVIEQDFIRDPARDNTSIPRYCWSSGTSRIWVGYENNLDPGDAIYKSVTGNSAGYVYQLYRLPSDDVFNRYPEGDSDHYYAWSSGTTFLWAYDNYVDYDLYHSPGGTSMGIIRTLDAQYLTAFTVISYVAGEYSHDYKFESIEEIITVGGVNYNRDASKDSTDGYAWVSGVNTVYTTVQRVWTGNYTVGGAAITGTTVNVMPLSESMQIAGDASHAAPFTDRPVDNYCSVIERELWGLYEHATSIRTITPDAWLRAPAADATTGTAKLPATGSVTITDFSQGGSSIDLITCPYYLLADCHTKEDDTDYPYEVRVMAGHVISSDTANGLIQSLDMHGESIGGKTLTVSIYLGMPHILRNMPFVSSYLNETSIKTSAVVTYGAADVAAMQAGGGTLIVLSGGTVTLTNCSINRAIVEPTGSLVLGTDDARVSDCCILTGIKNNAPISGAIVSAYTENLNADKVSSSYIDFDLVRTYQTSNTLVTADVQYTNGQRPPRSSVIVQSGATCTVQGMNWDSCFFLVSSGCSLIVTEDSILSGVTLLPGAQATISSSYIKSACIHSGAICHASGEWSESEGSAHLTAITSLCVLSGGKVTLNEYADYGGYIEGLSLVDYCSFDTGAVMQLYSAGTLVSKPIDLYDYKQARTRPTRSIVCTFFNHNLSANNTALVAGWNVITVTVPAGATSVSLATGNGNAADIPPVREILFTGVVGDEFRGNWDAGTTQWAGFVIGTIKVDGLDLTDKYPQFTYRKFGDDHK